MNILVLDLGTTNFKAAVFDATGSLVALSHLPTPVTAGATDRCEVAPDAFRASIAELLHGLDEQMPDITKRVGAITFATQTNSFVLLDVDNAPLTPIILWPDNRAVENQAEISSLTALPNFYATTGVSSLSHQFMLAKLAWLRTHEPNVIEQTARLCLISDYLTLWLTGQHVTEGGAAGLTGLLDIHALDWWHEACATSNVPIEWLPRVARAGTDLGAIGTDASHELGLPEGCRFVVGCLDQYAGAIGVGNFFPGELSETTGTVLATVHCSDGFLNDAASDVFQGPAFSDSIYYQMVFGDTGASWLEGYSNALPDAPSFATLDNEADEIPPGAEGLFLDPNCEPAARETLLAGWTRTHSRGHAVRAILEAVSFALANQVTSLCGENAPRRIACAGGAARSRLWLQIKADVLNSTMVAVDCPEPTCLGAAILAMHALSGDPVSQVAEAWVQPAYTVTPDEARHRIYATLRTQYSKS